MFSVLRAKKIGGKEKMRESVESSLLICDANVNKKKEMRRSLL